jgi:hypothetical protein
LFCYQANKATIVSNKVILGNLTNKLVTAFPGTEAEEEAGGGDGTSS